MIDKRPKTSATQNVSQVSGFACAISCDSFLRKCVELTSLRITLDSRVETLGVKRVKPGTKPS